MDQPWTHRQRPERLEGRLVFSDYEATRLFLERLEQLSQQQSRYPDISFGRTYVNLTLAPVSEGDDPVVTEADHAFAASIDALVD